MSKSSAIDSSSGPSINLPIARIRVDEHGAMEVTVDGQEFPTSTPETEWSRARFGELLDALCEHRTRTVRVEVHEYDGAVFTDIVYATRSGQVADAPRPSSSRRARHRTAHQLIELHGTGFIPGEDVTVALTLSTAEGSADGTARAVIDLSQISDQNPEILLIGRISGVIDVEQLPS